MHSDKSSMIDNNSPFNHFRCALIPAVLPFPYRGRAKKMFKSYILYSHVNDSFSVF